MMDEVIDFLRDYIETEYQILLVRYSERDEQLFLGQLAQIKPFLAPGVESNLERPPPDEDWFTIGKKMIAGGAVAPRTLFQVKMYRHSEHGDLYRAYVSDTSRPRGKRSNYFANFFVAPVLQQLKIISRYDLDILPDQKGERFEAQGLSWIWHSGLTIEELGTLIEVRKLQVPDESFALAEYLTE
jgi:hypothetical protein